LLPELVTTTEFFFAPLRTGEVVIFSPARKFGELLTFPVMDPSAFCFQFFITGMLSTGAAFLAPNLAFAGAFFAGAAFFTGAGFLAPNLDFGAAFLAGAGSATLAAGLFPNSENGFGAGVGAGAGSFTPKSLSF